MLSLTLGCLLLLASPEAEIRAVLDKQAADWNRGDVDAFMTSYENSPNTTYVGKSLARGYQQLLESYKKRYATREAMGTLHFSDVEVRLLGADAALVTGRFHLQRTAAGGGDASGTFTLVFRKTAAGWRIIHDHTS
jgi:uncharacterized protein (TIGR02246 family)